MVDYLYKDSVHIFSLSHCFIKFFDLSSDSDYGTNVYIIFYSFLSRTDECFTCFIDDDIEDLNIMFRRFNDDES